MPAYPQMSIKITSGCVPQTCTLLTMPVELCNAGFFESGSVSGISGA